MKKIALIGAQGVGKTTLAKMLVGQHTKAVLVPEVARNCPYPIDAAADFRTEWWVLSHAILAEKEATLHPGNLLIVADRCVLDISVYSNLVHQANPERVSVAELWMIERSIQTWMEASPYDAVILLTVDVEKWKTRDLDDGFRSTSLDWYMKLTEGFNRSLHLLPPKTKVFRLTNDGTTQEMLDKALQAINEVHE